MYFFCELILVGHVVVTETSGNLVSRAGTYCNTFVFFSYIHEEILSSWIIILSDKHVYKIHGFVLRLGLLGILFLQFNSLVPGWCGSNLKM